MGQAVFETVPVELMALLERADERHQWLRAAQRVGVLLIACQDAADVLAQLAAKPPDALLLPLGEREEESLLLCRAVMRRQTARGPCPVFLYDRGARLVRSAQDARRVGAEGWLPQMPLPEMLRAVLAEVDLPLDAEVPDGWQRAPSGLLGAEPSAAHGVRHEAGYGAQPPAQGAMRRADGGWFAPPAPAQPPQPPSPSPVEAFCRWLVQTLEAARTQHYLASLGLGLDATAEQAREAMRACADRVQAGCALPDLPAEALADAEALRDHLDDAWDVLSVPSRLAAYQRALARG